jgi:hypothetical protein
MPGYYWQGDTDLGHHLQFRSLIGFGWTLSQNSAVILSLDHISNAGPPTAIPGPRRLRCATVCRSDRPGRTARDTE